MTINEPKNPQHEDGHEDLVEARAARNEQPKRKDDGSIDEPKKPKVPWYRRRLLMTVISVSAVVAIVVGTVFYLHAQAHVTTDDAFIDAHVVQISPKVAGYAQLVAVDDNQHVNKGDLLLLVDPRDFQTQLDSANANLDAAKHRLNEAKSNVDVLKSMVEAAKATVTASQAEAEYARTQAARYEQLPSDAASAAEKASAEAARKSAEANVVANQSKVAAAESQLANGEAQANTAQSQVEVAQTQVEQALLNLSYTKITAPETGRVAKLAVFKGDYMETAQALMAIVPDDMWVVANFKETQLDRMRPGQPATIKIDAYPDKKYKAHVDSIHPGTGARFSLLPPENATGNYVKVVQRVPVKIVFDEKIPQELAISPGMSVEPDVKVK
jgi:membrane fusion protein (multidrug efflux system)